MTKPVSREAIFSGFFSLFSGLGQSGSPKGPFVTVTRRLREANEMQPGEMPALLQIQLQEVPRYAMDSVYGSKYDLDLYIYCYQADDTSPITPILNPLIDSVMAVLPPSGSALAITAGGAQTTVSVQVMKIDVFEGVLRDRAVARIGIQLQASSGA